MELLKELETLDFAYKDMVFKIRAKTDGRFIFKLLMSKYGKGDGIVVDADGYYDNVFRHFIVGWTGATCEGKEVPYTWENFTTRFPKAESDLFLLLLTFINEKTDLLGVGSAQEKNG